MLPTLLKSFIDQKSAAHDSDLALMYAVKGLEYNPESGALYVEAVRLELKAAADGEDYIPEARVAEILLKLTAYIEKNFDTN